MLDDCEISWRDRYRSGHNVLTVSLRRWCGRSKPNLDHFSNRTAGGRNFKSPPYLRVFASRF
jgi:hypothetical protein